MCTQAIKDPQWRTLLMSITDHTDKSLVLFNICQSITRPDISFSVNRLSQYLHQPTERRHMQSHKRLLQYLKGLHHGLFLQRSKGLHLTAFSDSDWGGSRSDARSTTRYVAYLGPNVVSWKSAKQKSVSRSSTEAEYKALANVVAELNWIFNLLQKLWLQISVPSGNLLTTLEPHISLLILFFILE